MLALFLVLAVMPFSAKSVASQDQCGRTSLQHQNDVDIPASLIAALAGEPEDEVQRIAILRDAIQIPPRNQADMAMQDRARLQLAAHAIRSNDFDTARDLLRQIGTSSPVAIDAGLLLAESWRLEGKPDQAIAWFMRVGRHFSDHARALEGMLEAAVTLEQTEQLGEAASLYSEIVQRATDIVATLQQLPTAPQARIDAVLSSQATVSPALRQQITHALLQNDRRAASTRKLQREAGRQWQCLLTQQQHLEERKAGIHSHQQSLKEAATVIKSALRELDDEIPILQSKIIAGDFSEAQIDFRRRLAAARNERARLVAEGKFIESIESVLPDALADTEARLTALTNSFASIHEKTSTEILKSLNYAIDDVEGTFRNLAGRSQHELSELKHRHIQ